MLTQTNYLKRWRPDNGDWYWFIWDTGKVGNTVCGGYKTDTARYYALNFFKTELKAKEALKRIKKVLEEYHKEIGE